jgi:carbonic anhydrase/acetyltransferase-like protein (isoleucine patch superfamily)
VRNRRLSEWQDAAIAGAGLVRCAAPTGRCLVLPDTVFVGAETLRAFVDGAAGRSAVLVLGNSVFVDQTAALQPDTERCAEGLRFGGIRLIGDGETVDVVVNPDEELQTVSRPASMGGDLTVPLARRPCIAVGHWMHLLAADRAAAALPLRTTAPWKLGLGLLGAVLRARSTNKWAVLAKLSEVGKGCDVHPTALIEGSVLEAGVTVGPHARVMFSHVAAGATVMGRATVEGSSIGAGALVGQGSVVRFCVVYPGAAACMPIVQMSVLGRDAATTQATWAMDANFENNVKVMMDGELRDSGTPFLGCAVGHGARVGTGLWIAAGREVPGGAFLIRDPRQTVRRISAGEVEGAPLVALDGHARPWAPTQGVGWTDVRPRGPGLSAPPSLVESPMSPRVLVHLAGEPADSLADSLDDEGIFALVIGELSDVLRALRSQGSVRVLVGPAPLPPALRETAAAQPRTVRVVEIDGDDFLGPIRAALAADRE